MTITTAVVTSEEVLSDRKKSTFLSPSDCVHFVSVLRVCTSHFAESSLSLLIVLVSESQVPAAQFKATGCTF